MQRRDFLASLGFSGYSLLVYADGPSSLEAAEISTDQMRREFAKVAPPEGQRSAAPHEPHMAQVAAWMDEAILAATKEDEQAIERVAAEVRELLAGFPMPGWATPV